MGYGFKVSLKNKHGKNHRVSVPTVHLRRPKIGRVCRVYTPAMEESSKRERKMNGNLRRLRTAWENVERSGGKRNTGKFLDVRGFAERMRRTCGRRRNDRGFVYSFKVNGRKERADTEEKHEHNEEHSEFPTTLVRSHSELLTKNSTQTCFLCPNRRCLVEEQLTQGPQGHS